MVSDEELNTALAEEPVLRLTMLAGVAADVLLKYGEIELAQQLQNAKDEVFKE